MKRDRERTKKKKKSKSKKRKIQNENNQYVQPVEESILYIGEPLDKKKSKCVVRFVDVPKMIVHEMYLEVKNCNPVPVTIEILKVSDGIGFSIKQPVYNIQEHGSTRIPITFLAKRERPKGISGRLQLLIKYEKRKYKKTIPLKANTALPSTPTKNSSMAINQVTPRLTKVAVTKTLARHNARGTLNMLNGSRKRLFENTAMSNVENRMVRGRKIKRRKKVQSNENLGNNPFDRNVVFIQSILRTMCYPKIETEVKCVLLCQSIMRKNLLFIQPLIRKHAVTIQSIARAKEIPKIENDRISIIEYQKAIRKYLVEPILSDLKTVMLVQSTIRSKLQKFEFSGILNIVLFSQSLVRKNMYSSPVESDRYHICLLQYSSKMMIQKSQINRYLAAIYLSQCVFRKTLDFENFMLTRNSSLMVQSVFRNLEIFKNRLKNPKNMKEDILISQYKLRGELERKKYKSSKKCVLLFQSSFKTEECSREFQESLKLVEFVQMRIKQIDVSEKYRNVVSNLLCFSQNLLRKNYFADDVRSNISSIVEVQSKIRGEIGFKEFVHLHSGNNFTQSSLRMLLESSKFKKTCFQITQLQSSYRAYKWRIFLNNGIEKLQFFQNFCRMDIQSSEFKNTRNHVILVQNGCRGVLANLKANKFVDSVTCCQSLIRRSIGEARFFNILSSVFWVEVASKRYSSKHEFGNTRNSILFVQSLVRSNLSITSRTLDLLKINNIQHRIKNLLDSRNFEKQLESVKIFQSLIRMKLIKKRENLMKRSMSVVFVQSIFKTHETKLLGSRVSEKIVFVQSSMRRTLAYGNLNRKLWRLKFTQSSIRANAEKKNFHKTLLENLNFSQNIMRKNFVNMNTLWNIRYLHYYTIVSQSVIRKNMYSQPIELWISSVINTQNCVRQKFAKSMFFEKRNIIKSFVQSKYRQLLIEKDKFLNLRNQIELIRNSQSFIRTQESRKLFELMKSTVIYTQSMIRRNLRKKEFLRTKYAIGYSQSLVRKKLQEIGYFTNFKNLRNSVIQIQSIIRSEIGFRKYVNSVRNNLCSLQSTLRMKLVRFGDSRNSVIQVQNPIRMMFLKTQFFENLGDIGICQNIIRTNNSTSISESSEPLILLQSKIRAKLGLRIFFNSRTDLIGVQSSIRTHGCKFETLKNMSYLGNSVCYTQSILRRSLLPEYQSRYVEKSVNYVIFVQACVRRNLRIPEFQNFIDGVTYTQSILRVSNNNPQRILDEIGNIEFIQSCSKRYEERLSHRGALRCIQFTQNVLRQVTDKRLFKNSIFEILPSVQGRIRTSIIKNSKFSSISKIMRTQSILRMRTDQISFKHKREGCLFVQTSIRGTLGKIQFHKDLFVVENCQQFARSNYRSNEIKILFRSCLFSQSVLKRNLCFSPNTPQSLFWLRNGIIYTQSVIRKELQERKTRQRFSDIQIALDMLRGIVVRSEFFEKFTKDRELIVFTQSVLRATPKKQFFQGAVKPLVAYSQTVILQNISRKDDQLLKNGVHDVGRSMRRYSAMQTFVEYFDKIVYLQCALRGFLYELEYENDMDELQKRIEARIRRIEEEKRLEEATREGLYTLLNMEKMTDLLKASQILDETTRSIAAEKCCKILCMPQAIKKIFDFIQSCNRSEPHLKLIGQLMGILSNLSNNEERAKMIYNCENSVSVICNQLLKHYDRRNIFPKGLSCIVNVTRSRKMKNTDIRKLKNIEMILTNKVKFGKKFGKLGKDEPSVFSYYSTCLEDLSEFLKE